MTKLSKREPNRSDRQMQRQRILRLAKFDDDLPVGEKFLDVVLGDQPRPLIVHTGEKRPLFEEELEPHAPGVFLKIAREPLTVVIHFFDADGFEPFQLAERANIASKPCCIQAVTRSRGDFRGNGLAGDPPEPHIGNVFDSWRVASLDTRLDVFVAVPRTMSRSSADRTHHTREGEHRRNDLSQSHRSSHPGA